MLSSTKLRNAGKTLIQTLFFFLLVTQICFGQWYQQLSGTGSMLMSVHFASSTNGWAVGENGTIISTTDGGNSWNAQLSGTTENLESVYFISSTNGWAVGVNTILNTTNGGNDWNTQLSGTFISYTSVYFTSSTTGWVVGSNGTILHTTNGGNNWNTQLSGTTMTLLSVCFPLTTTGWAVGGLGIVLHTTDGGNTWNTQLSGTTEVLESVSFPSTTTGWAVGASNTIIKTTDGGSNWITQTSQTFCYFLSVYFATSTIGWIVGYETILHTTDGGNNWDIQPCPPFSYLRSIYFISPTNGWTVGSDGIILHTTNGGVPVELASFTATTNGNEVLLNWSTATELNNLGFEIQRSIDGKEFFTVGFVNGHGTTTEQQSYSYADKNLDNGNYYYRLKQVDYDGSYEYSDVIEVDYRASSSYLLEQCYPNPFNPTTSIGFGVQTKSNVKIIVLNAIGEEVAVVLNEEREPGFHQVEFNAANLPSGVYFYELKAGEYSSVKKMVLLK